MHRERKTYTNLTFKNYRIMERYLNTKNYLQSWANGESICIYAPHNYNVNCGVGYDRVFSYNTVIAQYGRKDGQTVVVINRTYYSKTTSKHVNYIINAYKNRANAGRYTPELIFVTNVPRGCANIREFADIEEFAG